MIKKRKVITVAEGSDGRKSRQRKVQDEDDENSGYGCTHRSPLLDAVVDEVMEIVDAGAEIIGEIVRETSYLSDANLRAIADYKFTSGQYTILDQLLYKWWWIPCLLKVVPHWISPNCLTVMGFVFSITAFVAVYLESPDLTEPLSTGTCVIAAMCIFLYQTLDALDGLHARKYGYGSPLGQLMDHGCDSFTTGFLCFVHIAIFRLGINNWTSFFYVICYQNTLFVYSWWEKTFHEFRSNSANKGVTEGQILLIVQLLLIAVYGHDIYHANIVDVCRIIIPDSVFCLLDFGYDYVSHSKYCLFFWDDLVRSTSYNATQYLIRLARLDSFCQWLTTLSLVETIMLFNYYLQGDMLRSDLINSIYRCYKEDKMKALAEWSIFAVHILALVCIFFSVLPPEYGVPRYVPYVSSSLCGGIVTIRLILSTVGKRELSKIQWPHIPVLIGNGSIVAMKWKFGSDFWFLRSYGFHLSVALMILQLLIAGQLVLVSVMLLREHLELRVFHVPSKKGINSTTTTANNTPEKNSEREAETTTERH